MGGLDLGGNGGSETDQQRVYKNVTHTHKNGYFNTAPLIHLFILGG